MYLKLSKSIRKHIRQEKAKIHREVFNLEKQKNLFKALYEKFGLDKKESPLLKNKDKK